MKETGITTQGTQQGAAHGSATPGSAHGGPPLRKSMPGDHPEHRYKEFEAAVRQRIHELAGPIFTTNAEHDALWNAYIAPIDPAVRQHYTCRCCRKFIEKYGGLVTITAEGHQVPAVWPDNNPPFFQASVYALGRLAQRSKVTGVFLWDPDETTWGTPSNFAHSEPTVWSHLHGIPCAPPCRHALLNAEQVMAEKKEEYAMLSRGIGEFGPDAVAQALRVLNHPDVPRAEKALGAANWLAALHDSIKATRGERKANIIWLAVATAPPGWTHIRSSLIGTLLEDVVSGLPFATICRRWTEKVHPLRYQRPTAAPKIGAIKQAEEAFAKLGLAPSLERRYATTADVLKWVWRPTSAGTAVPDDGKKGLFDHLKVQVRRREVVQEIALPPVATSWEKFRDKILPGAETMEVMTPYERAPFYGLLTAIHPDAPPLLQWDGLTGEVLEDRPGSAACGTMVNVDLPRNPVSHYFYISGSMAHEWGLPPRSWIKVTGVFDKPCHWQRPDLFKHYPAAAHFALEGCVNMAAAAGNGSSLGLFPETIRTDLHHVRSVIEAYSNSAHPTGHDEPDQVNGIAIQSAIKQFMPLTVRIKGSRGMETYRIERWD